MTRTPRNPRVAKPHLPAKAGTPGSWIVETGGAGGSGGGGGAVLGPVTGFASAGEIGTRYSIAPDNQVILTIGFVPICPTPQPVTYLVSADAGATWIWIGSQRMQSAGQQLKVARLAPGATGSWRMAACAGDLGGDPTPIPDANLVVLYPGVVRSAPFTVLGLSVPPAAMGITATIGACVNVLSADGFTQSGRIPGVIYTDPVGSTAFFVRITVQILDATRAALGPEQAYGGTQITGGSHTEAPLLVTYVPGLAFERYRFYVANRNSQGGGDFSNPATNTLQQVSFNGGALADHYDVPITIPPFVPPVNPDSAFNVLSVTASEVGPKYQDEKQGLHTSVGIVPVIDHDYASPRTVTIWLDFGTGTPVWQGWFSLSAGGQVVRLGDATLGTDGTRKSGNIWVPANTAQGNWIAYCGAGHLDNGIPPTAYASVHFTVAPVGACIANGTTAAQFLADPTTSDPIVYSKYDPGIWYWEYYCLTLTPPTIAQDSNYWFTLITVQKGATIGGVWTPAPDPEGLNEDPFGNYLGRVHAQINQLPGVSGGQTAILRKFGARPSTWVIPVAQKEDLTPNPYREFRFLAYNVSRLGTDTSGSGGAGTYTLQTSCWPGASDHSILIPQPKNGSLDFRAANPNTILAPLTGGNGQPLAIPPGGIGNDYLGPQAVHAINMAQDSITAANNALAAGAVVDAKVHDVSIGKVTYGTTVFAGDVVLSRGIGLPVIVLQNTGIFLYGQADASAGTAGLTSKPYVGIQNAAIGLFEGGAGGSVFLDGAANAITIYSKNGDLTKPYFTTSATALSMVNGPNSVTINSNAMAFVDTAFGNRLDTSSAGVSLSTGTNKLVILANSLQLQLAGVARVTLDTSAGVTVSNGGTSSVVVGNSTVQITATGAQATFSANQIQMVQGGATVTITAASLKLSNGTSSVELTASAVIITNGSFTSPAINGGSLTIVSGTVTINIDGTNYVKVHNSSGFNTCQMTGDYVQVSRTGGGTAQLEPGFLVLAAPDGSNMEMTPGGLTFQPAAGGSTTLIDGNQIWRKGVQCVDHVIGIDFGISGVGFGGGTQASPLRFTSADGKTVTVIGGLVMSAA